MSTQSRLKPRPAAHRRLGSDAIEAAFLNAATTSQDTKYAAAPPLAPPFQDQPGDVQLKPIRTLSYDDSNHWSVLSQMHGSVWPYVLKFCLVNVALTFLVYYLQRNYRDISCDPSGHKFMSLILSFLVVTRAKITYSRFMEARSYLESSYRVCAELVQHMCVLTQEDTSEGARVWRHNVSYRTLLLLRVTMAAIEYKSQKKTSWEIPEFTSDDRKDVEWTLQRLRLSRSRSGDTANTDDSERYSKNGGGDDADDKEKLQEESFRAPILLALNLRREIMEQRTGAFLEKPFRHVNEELKLLDYVTDFMKAFHGLNKLVETPFPFPLVQMTRTFLFVFVFTLPFVLMNDEIERLVEPLCIIFLTTYGFIGLEYVCMELDDPFGDDPNDFDDLGMAQLVFEDIYIAIYKLDGEKAAHDLRRKIVARIQQGPALEVFKEEYQSGYNPIVEEDTIKFDRRAYYKDNKKDDCLKPFRTAAIVARTSSSFSETSEKIVAAPRSSVSEKLNEGSDAAKKYTVKLKLPPMPKRIRSKRPPST